MATYVKLEAELGSHSILRQKQPIQHQATSQDVCVIKGHPTQWAGAGGEEVCGGPGRGFQPPRPAGQDLHCSPPLRRTEVMLSWIDDDGDEVRIGTAEELVVAMAEQAGPVYKLRVKPGIRHQQSATSQK